ncbi:MAG: shikimate dehydrogenase [Acidobacteriota bacterium]
MNFKAELVACFGQPVAENPTGVMQEAAFAAAGLPWRYLTIEVDPGGLVDAVRGARAMGFRGFNCTIPHKVAVLPLLDELSKEARIIVAVNTVRREGDRFIGENTDGKGFLRGMTHDAGMDPRGKRVVLLGAGGAARAIATELLLAGVEELIVVNRSVERAAPMVEDLQPHGPIRFVPWRVQYAVGPETDLLVNATSLGLYPNVDWMPDVDLGRARCLVADAVFNPPVTKFLAAAQARGLPTLDGLTMLVYQGFIGFTMWTGVAPDEAVMKQTLRKAMVES